MLARAPLPRLRRLPCSPSARKELEEEGPRGAGARAGAAVVRAGVRRVWGAPVPRGRDAAGRSRSLWGRWGGSSRGGGAWGASGSGWACRRRCAPVAAHRPLRCRWQDDSVVDDHRGAARRQGALGLTPRRHEGRGRRSGGSGPSSSSCCCHGRAGSGAAPGRRGRRCAWQRRGEGGRCCGSWGREIKQPRLQGQGNGSSRGWRGGCSSSSSCCCCCWLGDGRGSGGGCLPRPQRTAPVCALDDRRDLERNEEERDVDGGRRGAPASSPSSRRWNRWGESSGGGRGGSGGRLAPPRSLHGARGEVRTAARRREKARRRARRVRAATREDQRRRWRRLHVRHRIPPTPARRSHLDVVVARDVVCERRTNTRARRVVAADALLEATEGGRVRTRGTAIPQNSVNGRRDAGRNVFQALLLAPPLSLGAVSAWRRVGTRRSKRGWAIGGARELRWCCTRLAHFSQLLDAPHRLHRLGGHTRSTDWRLDTPSE